MSIELRNNYTVKKIKEKKVGVRFIEPVSGRINPTPTGNKRTIKALGFDKIVTDYFSDCLVGEFNFRLVSWQTG